MEILALVSKSNLDEEGVLGRKFGQRVNHNEGLRRLKDLGGGVKDFKLSCEVQRHL